MVRVEAVRTFRLKSPDAGSVRVVVGQKLRMPVHDAIRLEKKGMVRIIRPSAYCSVLGRRVSIVNDPGDYEVFDRASYMGTELLILRQKRKEEAEAIDLVKGVFQGSVLKS